MYCTGGIRCERASAFLKSLNLCQEIYQLGGGIHEYIEQYPDGHFKGKNYVFDDRVAIKANDHKVSTCNYCDEFFDDYEKCCSDGCFIVSLCCLKCREARDGKFYCCAVCKEKHSGQVRKGTPCLCQTERMKYPTVEEFYREMKKVSFST
eukprot:TRINITY_DN788_c0_g1_i2.p1 TRINITY_DN788_c0_g1~~TRINITY_DN788_c0_g1_i2.p1  ORF type:complete len:150 (-),score=23.19 TRINITY_DN788_c0_g1_i2:102-551(-)